MTIIEGFASEGIEIFPERNSWGRDAGDVLRCDGKQLRLHTPWPWSRVTVTDDQGLDVLSCRLSMEFLF